MEVAKLAEGLPQLRKDLLKQARQDNMEQVAEIGKKILKAGRLAPGDVNNLAWEMLTELPVHQMDIQLAMELAELAVEATKSENYASLDTLGLAYFKMNKLEQAITVQRKAVEQCKKVSKKCRDIEKPLKKYLAAQKKQ